MPQGVKDPPVGSTFRSSVPRGAQNSGGEGNRVIGDFSFADPVLARALTRLELSSSVALTHYGNRRVRHHYNKAFQPTLGLRYSRDRVRAEFGLGIRVTVMVYMGINTVTREAEAAADLLSDHGWADYTF